MANIVIITPGLLPVPSVLGGAVETLIDMFISNTKLYQNNNISIYTVYNSKNEEHQKYKIHCINDKKISFKVKRILRKIINSIPKVYIGNQYIHSVIKKMKKNCEKYDIIIVENDPLFGIVLRKSFPKTKIVLHLHNDFLNEKSKLNMKAIKSYDKILPISNALKYEIEKIDGKNKKIQVLYNGIELEKFRNVDEEKQRKLRCELQIKEKEIVFMYSGRIVPEKGVVELIEAFVELSLKDAKLVIIGKPSSKKFLRVIKKIIKNNLNIIYKEYIDYSNINYYYKIADIGIIPSKCNEAFGLVVLEFLASGKPVIISDMGGMKEVASYKSRFMVKNDGNLKDNIKCAINKYLSMDKEKIGLLKKYATIDSLKFSLENYIGNFDKIIEGVINEKK